MGKPSLSTPHPTAARLLCSPNTPPTPTPSVLGPSRNRDSLPSFFSRKALESLGEGTGPEPAQHPQTPSLASRTQDLEKMAQQAGPLRVLQTDLQTKGPADHTHSATGGRASGSGSPHGPPTWGWISEAV